MTPREEKTMLRDIHKLEITMEKIAMSLEDIAKSLKGPVYVAMCDCKEETDEETRE